MILLGMIGLIVVAQTDAGAPITVGSAKTVAVQAETPLFAFTRADGTREQTTTVHIDAARHAAAPIHQDVFGNFIEHLGDVVYPGLWAQALQNPNLELIDPDDPEPRMWHLVGATWEKNGRHSPRCVRLTNKSVMMQDLFLPTHRTRDYVLTFAARTAATPGSDKITFTIQGIGAKEGNVYLQQTEKVADST